MNWIPLSTKEQLAEIQTISEQQPVLIFKHSTRCSISATALNRLERAWKEDEMATKVKPYYLDLLSFRPLSTEIASSYNITHQSPQVLLIYRGECVYDTSHLDISYNS
jgi:bacillithiol system protein YtxJ